MSIVKPGDHKRKSRKEIIEEVLKDLSPGVRDEARRLLEELPVERLGVDELRGFLKRRGFKLLK